MLPRFTSTGFEVTQLPHDLRCLLSRYWLEARGRRNWRVEHVPPALIYLDPALKIEPLALSRPVTCLLPMYAALRRRLETWTATALTEWTGVEPLQHHTTYGVREYSRGAILRCHVDRLRSHALSAIIHIGHTGLEQPWPLQIFNHEL